MGREQIRHILLEAELSDTQVHQELQKIRTAHKAAMTRAGRKYHQEKERIFSFFQGSSDDVTQASRANALDRAAKIFDDEAATASAKKKAALDDLRGRAGEWADLVG